MRPTSSEEDEVVSETAKDLAGQPAVKFDHKRVDVQNVDRPTVVILSFNTENVFYTMGARKGKSSQ